MNRGCTQFNASLLRTLDATERLAAERHTETCEACQEARRQWERDLAELEAWAQTKTVSAPTPVQVSRLSNRARPRSPHRVRLAWAWGAGFAAVTAVMAVWVVRSPQPSVEEAPLSISVLRGSGYAPVAEGSMATGTSLAVPGQGELVALIGPDRVALGSMSHSRVAQATLQSTVLELDHGRIAFRVTPRPNHHFFVDAGRYRVEVTGTEFEVTLSEKGLELGVTRGSVSLSERGAWQMSVAAGEGVMASRDAPPARSTLTPAAELRVHRALDGEAAAGVDSGETAPAADSGEPATKTDNAKDDDLVEARAGARPNKAAVVKPHSGERTAEAEADRLARWNRLIESNSLRDAKEELLAFVQAHPSDANALWVLATCQRKLEEFRAAAESYGRLSALSDAATHNRARFLAAAIYQDHLGAAAEAVPLLDSYVRAAPATDPVLPEAWLRLAKAHAVEGRRDRAIEIYTDILTRFRGTAAALEAKALKHRLETQSDH